jgi:hypothetical protein
MSERPLGPLNRPPERPPLPHEQYPPKERKCKDGGTSALVKALAFIGAGALVLGFLGHSTPAAASDRASQRQR